MTDGERAWIVLAAGIIAWDVFGSETLSTAAYRHPRKTWGIGVLLLAHLVRLIPPRLDPIRAMFTVLAAIKGPPAKPMTD